MLTVRRPSSVPALNTRMAISPRLAHRIFLNGTSPVWKVCKKSWIRLLQTFHRLGRWCRARTSRPSLCDTCADTSRIGV
jgi:hypothetical protein